MNVEAHEVVVTVFFFGCDCEGPNPKYEKMKTTLSPENKQLEQGLTKILHKSKRGLVNKIWKNTRCKSG